MFIYVILASISLIIYLPMSLYWTLAFLRRIYLIRIYTRGAVRNTAESCNAGYINEQYCYHFQTEIWKYVFLFSINLAEAIRAIFFLITQGSKEYLQLYSNRYHHNVSRFVNHEGVNNTFILDYQVTESSIDSINAINSLGNCADLFVFALGICLMNYLTKRIKKVENLSGVLNNKRFLFATFITCIMITILSNIGPLLNIGRVLFILTSYFYFGIFVRTVKQFRITLRMRSIQSLTQFGFNNRELKECKYFNYTSTAVCIGFKFLLIVIILTNTLNISLCYLFFREDFFPFNLFPHEAYSPVLKTDTQIQLFIMILKPLKVVLDVTFFIGLTFLISPCIVCTIHSWYRLVYNAIKGTTVVRIKVWELNESLTIHP